METLYRKRSFIAGNVLSALALSSCSFGIDSYLNDVSDVECDGKRTKTDLAGDGLATFVVHGNDGVATVTVRRESEEVSVRAEGNVTGPPQTLEADGFTAPTPIVDGAELSTFGAGGAWVIDVRQDSVVIQGSCEGM